MEASKFAQESGITFLETSALTGDNVEEVFLMCARDILTRIENGLFQWLQMSLLCCLFTVEQSSAGSLDPSKVGSGVQVGETSSSSVVVDDTDDGASGSAAKCSC